jgi:hypothetical protein
LAFANSGRKIGATLGNDAREGESKEDEEI